MENVIDIAVHWFFILMAVVGAASLIVQGLAQIAAVTPSTRDDEIIGKVQGFLTWLAKILDKVALNLPADKARRP
ncbi:hypothetical protein ACW5WK_02640 [Aeromonas enteropelogenes]|uniref:hypothetical protein n=1 Tax=Aeromonas enteropelogenes TaxID=29489 RepID=UPI0005A7BDCA|nr:hypothetical protein [Aeromonas enteropelogenes]UBH56274.1 hypothetical protein LA341_20770 [Aeromonas enteropelogenes]